MQQQQQPHLQGPLHEQQPQQPHPNLYLLKQLSREVSELDIGDAVDIISDVDAATFLREYVASNKPVLIKGAIDHWPALRHWSRSVLQAKAGQLQVSVATTPNGFADAVTPFATDDGGEGHCFCLPHTQTMAFGDFLSLLLEGREGLVPYLQQQNSNLTEEFPLLLEDVEGQLGFAAEAFGAAPDAVNLWIGDQRSATTFHKDHYENVYAVLRGKKIFHLLPPTDVYRMQLGLYPAAQYQQVQGALVPVLTQPPSQVLWCPILPEPADADSARLQHPLYFDPSLPKPLRVEVGVGDVLYLPAMWWHYVQQQCNADEGWCVAVNYWYDMRFDLRYATYNMVAAMAEAAGLLPAMPEDVDTDTSSRGPASNDDSGDDSSSSSSGG